MKSKNERKIALQVITQVIENKASLSQVLNPEYSAFTKALCYGVCRHYYRLAAIAHTLMPKKPKENKVWLAIILGLYQLFYLNQPDYAVVKETVDLVTKTPWAKGLINAVLRNACRQKESLLLLLQNHSGHPDWLVEKMQQHWPKDIGDILKANDSHPPLVLRVNLQKNTLEHYQQLLKKANFAAHQHPLAPEALILEQAVDVADLPGFFDGLVSVQDAAAQLAAHWMDLKPGLRILDACCAPGGKTAHILELQPDGDCVAIDIDEKRMQKVKDTLQRLQLKAHCIVADAIKPEVFWDGKPFDRILLDAPCSATGVIRRHPDIKLLRTPDAVTSVMAIQKDLLEKLWPLLAQNGLMVYATCSILPEENAEQIQAFIDTHPDCIVEKTDKIAGIWTGYGWQILPGFQNMDGFFYSVLRKC